MGEDMEKEQWMKESLQMQKASWIQNEITKRREREDELLQQIFMIMTPNITMHSQ